MFIKKVIPVSTPKSVGLTAISVPKEGVSIHLRVRPLLPEETSGGHTLAPWVRHYDDTCIRFGKMVYNFDQIYSDKISTWSIFQDIRPQLTQVLQNNIMMYGQSGAGKTFSMFHPDDGLLYLTLNALFTEYDTVSVCALELYKNEIVDMVTQQSLVMMASGKRARPGFVGKLSRKKVDLDDMSIPLTKGTYRQHVDWIKSQRHSAKTDLNLDSSRSHLCLQLRYGPYLTNCFDLAGTGESTSTHEGNAIRQDLSGLTSLITSMTSPKKGIFYHPRNTTFTRFVHSYLDGALTFLLALVSPSDSHKALTARTLQFAKQFKTLKISKNNQERDYFSKLRSQYAKQYQRYQLLINKHGKIVSTSDKGLPELGWSKKELVGTDFPSLVPQFFETFGGVFEPDHGSFFSTFNVHMKTEGSVKRCRSKNDIFSKQRTWEMLAKEGDSKAMTIMFNVHPDKRYRHVFSAFVAPFETDKSDGHLADGSFHEIQSSQGMERPPFESDTEAYLSDNYSDESDAERSGTSLDHSQDGTVIIKADSVTSSSTKKGVLSVSHLEGANLPGKSVLNSVPYPPMISVSSPPSVTLMHRSSALDIQLTLGSNSIELEAHTNLVISQHVLQTDIVETENANLFPLFHSLALQKKLEHQYYHSTVLISTLFEKATLQGVSMSEWPSFIDQELQRPPEPVSFGIMASSDPEITYPQNEIPVTNRDSQSLAWGCCAPPLF